MIKINTVYLESMFFTAVILLGTVFVSSAVFAVDTDQQHCYNDARAIACPGPGEDFHGQDAQ